MSIAAVDNAPLKKLQICGRVRCEAVLEALVHTLKTFCSLQWINEQRETLTDENGSS